MLADANTGMQTSQRHDERVTVTFGGTCHGTTGKTLWDPVQMGWARHGSATKSRPNLSCLGEGGMRSSAAMTVVASLSARDSRASAGGKMLPFKQLDSTRAPGLISGEHSVLNPAT